MKFDRVGGLSARYVPMSQSDAALLEYRLNQLGERLDTKTNHNADLRLMPGLLVADLPFLQDLDAELLLAIREDEPAFQDWRSELRNAIRHVESLPSEGIAFESEARDVLQDALLPRANAVSQAVSGSQVMKDAAKDGITELGVSVGSIGWAAGAMGPEGAAGAALAAGIALPLRWLMKVCFRPTPTGANGVLAQLIQRR